MGGRLFEDDGIMNDEPTVFLVDADRRTRDAVRDLLDTMNLPHEEYTSGQAFLDAYDPSRAGCVVLEVRIPDVNGLEIQDRLAARGASIPLVFLSAEAPVSIAVRAMRGGAVHFVEKPFRAHELWDAIREATLLDAKRRRAAAEREALDRRLADLAPEERRVLELIAAGKSKQAMAAEAGVSIRTIEVRRSRLMSKLALTSPVELVVFALTACNGHCGSFRGMEGVGPILRRPPT